MAEASFLHDAGIAVVGGIITAIGFLAKRRMTSAPADESLQRKSRVLEITKSLADQNLTLDQLDAIEERLTRRRERLNDATAVERAAESLTEIISSGGMTQSAMNQLAAREAKLADEQLQAEFQRFLAALEDDPERQQKLRESQERWNAFRDAQENLAASIAEGGSMRPTVLFSEREALTRERIAQIRRAVWE
jgi:uncharacterized protein YecT (DUF1311 family)